jgi:hypothetical protein
MGNANWIIIGIVLIIVVIGVSILSHLSGQLDSTGEVSQDSSFLKFSHGVNNGFLFLFLFSIGSFILYYSVKEKYENYRIRNDSKMMIGKVQSLKYFKDRRGTRNRKSSWFFKSHFQSKAQCLGTRRHCKFSVRAIGSTQWYEY